MFKKTAISLLPALAALVFGVRAHASTDKPFAPVPTPYAAVSAPADPDDFTFVVTGDNRSTGHGYPMPPCFEEICREIGIVHPAFTFWTGDCIEGYGDTVDEANAEYDVFLKGLALTDTPVFNAPGNHEFSLDKALLPVYLKRIGALYGSFDYGHSHFIALNSNAVGPDGTITGGSIDAAQLQWLESDLKANAGAKNIFVFLHHYVFGPKDPDDPKLDSGFVSEEERDALHRLFVKYGVRAVFCGHAHLYWHQQKDGVDYYISGGAGAPLDAGPEQGGYLHYIVVHVAGSKIDTQILQPWHLALQYQSGDPQEAAAAAAGSVWVTNTNRDDLDLTVPFRIAAPAGGAKPVAAARIAYKNKMKTVDATVVSATPAADGTETVLVSLPVKEDRTVEVSVGPAAQAAAK